MIFRYVWIRTFDIQYLQSWGREGGSSGAEADFLHKCAQKLVFLIIKCSHKVYNYCGARLFSLAAKFLCRTGRKVPSGLGNTAKHLGKRLLWLTLCILHSYSYMGGREGERGKCCPMRYLPGAGGERLHSLPGTRTQDVAEASGRATQLASHSHLISCFYFMSALDLSLTKSGSGRTAATSIHR